MLKMLLYGGGGLLLGWFIFSKLTGRATAIPKNIVPSPPTQPSAQPSKPSIQTTSPATGFSLLSKNLGLKDATLTSVGNTLTTAEEVGNVIQKEFSI